MYFNPKVEDTLSISGMIVGASTALNMRTTIVAQTFNAILNPNDSYTNEYYDSSIPLGLVGFSKFERV